MWVFFFPWGHVSFYDQIWALQRHLGHVCQILPSDWLIQNLLRSDWLQTIVACITTKDTGPVEERQLPSLSNPWNNRP